MIAELYFFEDLSEESQERALSSHREEYKNKMGEYPRGAAAEIQSGMFYADGSKYSKAVYIGVINGQKLLRCRGNYYESAII